jgi:hypothetical protein
MNIYILDDEVKEKEILGRNKEREKKNMCNPI